MSLGRKRRETLSRSLSNNSIVLLLIVLVITVLFIVSITKFSILIGSLYSYLSRNRPTLSRVCPITGIHFELFVIGYLQSDTHVIHISITCVCCMHTLMASFAIFPSVFKTYMKSAQKSSSQKTFFIPKFVLDKIN